MKLGISYFDKSWNKFLYNYVGGITTRATPYGAATNWVVPANT